MNVGNPSARDDIRILIESPESADQGNGDSWPPRYLDLAGRPSAAATEVGGNTPASVVPIVLGIRFPL